MVAAAARAAAALAVAGRRASGRTANADPSAVISRPTSSGRAAGRRSA